MELLNDKLFDRGIGFTGFVVFMGLIIWGAVQLLGKNGVARSIDHTLIELKDLSANQQNVCTRHASAMEGLKELPVDAKIAATNSEAIAEVWAEQDAEDFKTRHLTAGGMAACDVLDKMLPDAPELVDRVRQKLRGK